MKPKPTYHVEAIFCGGVNTSVYGGTSTLIVGEHSPVDGQRGGTGVVSVCRLPGSLQGRPDMTLPPCFPLRRISLLEEAQSSAGGGCVCLALVLREMCCRTSSIATFVEESIFSRTNLARGI